MKKNALASLLLAFATAFVLADNLGTTSLVGDLSSTSDYVYTADQTDAVIGAAKTAAFAYTTAVSNTLGEAISAIPTYTHPSYTARTGKPTADASPGFGGTFTVSQITSDSSGHVTGATDRTITIPSAAATTSAAGLMSADDKTLLGKTITKVRMPNATADSDPMNQYTYLDTYDVSIQGQIEAKGVTLPLSVASGQTGPKHGLMSASDKAKLDGIAAGANAYTHPTYTARTGKPTGNQTPGFGGTFTVSQITSDSSGHVTGATDRTITIPSAAATTSAAGLMSASDKTALDSLSSGAVLKTTVSAALTAQGIASNDDIDTLNETIAELKKVIAVLEALD